MAASYPTAVVEFSAKANLVDTIVADHVNRLQEEVVATQNTLSTDILTSAYTATFAQTTDWATLQDRLLNIEGGLVNGVAGTPYVRKDLANAMTPPSGSVAISISSASGNSANLFETKTSGGTTKFRVDSAGEPKVGSAEVLYVGSTTATSLQDQITAVSNAVKGALNPLLLIG